MTRPCLRGALTFYIVIDCCTFALFFFFNDPATTEIYTLSLHELFRSRDGTLFYWSGAVDNAQNSLVWVEDRKSTRLNSSHSQISYAVFCLKKKKEMQEKIAG